MSKKQPPHELPTRRHPQTAPRRPPSERVPQTRTEVSQKNRTQQLGATKRHKVTKRPSSPPPYHEYRSSPGSSALYVPWWGFALVILVVAGLTCGLWGVVLASRGDAATNLGSTPTPIFIVITSTPTLGSDQSGDEANVTLTATPTDLPFPEVTPTSASSATILQIGSKIVIVGTGGDGLAIRQGPGRDYSYFFVGNDGDIFIIEDGPREADGYIWWYIVDPDNPDRAGWAAADFLEIVP